MTTNLFPAHPSELPLQADPGDFVDTAKADTKVGQEIVPVGGSFYESPIVPALHIFPPADPILGEDMHALHAVINAIAPISGLAIVDGLPVDIEYVTPPTPEQETQIAQALDAWEDLQAKNAQLRLIEASWQATISAGWTTPYGWKLGLTPQDITLLTGAFILAKEAQIMGLASSGVIVDTDGLAHELSVADLTGLMLQYGQARAALSATYAASKAALG
jgi:hypothetical protein